MNWLERFYWQREGWIMAGIMVCGILFLVLIVILAVYQESRLMEDCLQDGRKEYECRGILRGGGTIRP